MASPIVHSPRGVLECSGSVLFLGYHHVHVYLAHNDGTRAMVCWKFDFDQNVSEEIQKGKRNDNKRKKQGFLVRLGGLSRLTEAKVPITIDPRWLVSQ